MLNFFTANTISEAICLIIAIICLISDHDLTWRIMIPYLLITCVAEFLGIYIGRQNHWVYNLFIIFEAGFTNFIFARLLNKYTNSNFLIAVGISLFVISYFYEILIHGFFKYNNITFTIISVEFVLYSLYYYYLLLKDGDYIVLKYSPAFWWVAGTLFFYFAVTACNLFDDELYSVMVTPKHHLTYFIFKILNIILYSCWSYSFICKKWLTKTSQS